MKRILPVLSIFLLAAAFSCSKNGSTTPLEEAATKFPPPAWKEDTTGKYPASMIAIVALPESLAGNTMEHDEMAAFVSGECRGVGVPVKVNNQTLYFFLVRGLPDETSQVKFRYYSSKSSYMYETKTAIKFFVDGIYGTAQNPERLELLQLK